MDFAIASAARPDLALRLFRNPKPETRTHQDIPGLGRDGEVLEVKPGRARNHLVPGRLAVYATPARAAEGAERRAAWTDENETSATDDDEEQAVRLSLIRFTRSRVASVYAIERSASTPIDPAPTLDSRMPATPRDSRNELARRTCESNSRDGSQKTKRGDE